MKISLQNVDDISKIIGGGMVDLHPNNVLYLYEINRCGTCGCPWHDHDMNCFRHDLSGLYGSLRNKLKDNHNFYSFFGQHRMVTGSQAEFVDGTLTINRGMDENEMIQDHADGLNGNVAMKLMINNQ